MNILFLLAVNIHLYYKVQLVNAVLKKKMFFIVRIIQDI